MDEYWRHPRNMFDISEAANRSDTSSRPDRSEAANRLNQEQQPAEVAPSYVEDLEKEIERLRGELAAQEELVRKYAVKAHEAEVDVERAKQRIEREACKENTQRRRQFLVGFLSVLDNLDRALNAAPAGDDSLVQGVELVRRDFLAKLTEYGVTHFESFGQPFDPTRHQALSRVPVASPEQDGIVIAVVQEGYAIAGETLRAASVAVGQYVAQF